MEELDDSAANTFTYLVEGGGKRKVKAIVDVMISTWKETMLLEGYSQENIQIAWVKTGV